MSSFTVYSPVGIVGYAFPESSFRRSITLPLDAIGGDGGSTDPGPYYLGAGEAHVSAEAVRRDMRLMLMGAQELAVPLIVGSAGTAGGEPHLQWLRTIVEDLANELHLHLKLAVIHSEQPKDYVLNRLRAGKVWPLGSAVQLDETLISRSTRIVGVMGAEPIISALDSGADVVLAGRSSDAAIFAAAPLRAGFPAGPTWHMAKVLECGSAAAIPKKGSDGLIGSVDGDGFTVEPASLEMRCTTDRVAAHTLYENPSPYEIREPSGTLDTANSTYTQFSDRAVRVEGSKLRSETYTVKLESVEMIGYRALTIVGIRDPVLLGQLDGFLRDVEQMVLDRQIAESDSYKVIFHVYGRNGVMGDLEPERQRISHEVGIVVDVVAREQQVANAILALTRTFMQVSDFPGRLCTAGNIAYPFSPNGISVGPVYRFNMWHVVEPDSPLEMFPVDLLEV